MANFGAFMQGIGLAAGNNMIVGQQMEEQQASIDYKKNQVAMQKMDMLQRQTEMANQKTEGEFFASQLALDKSDADIASKTAKAASIASAHFAQTGDLVGMKKYAEMARGYTEEAQKAQALHLSEQHEKQVAVSEAAADYNAAPPEQKEGLKNNVIKAALAAGTPMSELTPILNDPAKFATFANNQQLKTKEGMARQKLVTDEVDRKDKQAEAALHNKSEEELRLLQIRSLAASRDLAASIRAEGKTDKAPVFHEINGYNYEFDPTGKVKGIRDTEDTRMVRVGGPKISLTQQGHISQALEATQQVAIKLDNMLQFNMGTYYSPFKNLHGDTLVQAFAKVGAEKATPSEIQMYTKNITSLGTDLGRAVTAFGGRGASLGLNLELEAAAGAAGGSTKAAQAYGAAIAAQIARGVLKSMPTINDPKQKESNDAQLIELAKYPTPNEVLAAAQKAGHGRDIEKFKGKMGDMLKTLKEKAAKTNPQGLSGEELSVMQQSKFSATGASGLSAAQQALFDKY